MKRNRALLIILVICFGCSSSKSTPDSSISKQLESLVESRSFEIECDWAQPQMTSAMNQIQNLGLFPIGSTGGNINLTGVASYVKMTQDTISGYLPYYGEQRLSSSYANNEMGVAFEGVPKNLTIEQRKKNGYAISFSINDKYKTSENYNVYITLFSNLTSNININSSHRTTISYTGHVKSLPDKDNDFDK